MAADSEVCSNRGGLDDSRLLRDGERACTAGSPAAAELRRPGVYAPGPGLRPRFGQGERRTRLCSLVDLVYDTLPRHAGVTAVTVPWSGLVVCIDPDGTDETAEQDAVYAVLRRAMTASLCACEVCDELGRLPRGPWYCTRCDLHA